MWYKLGVELLEDSSLLDEIKADHSNDCETCCIVMFKYWSDMKA